MSYIKTTFARNLRQEATPEEIKIRKLLRNRKYFRYKFRRQYVIKGFVYDFYCHELRLAIELDGKVHENQKEYDDLRQQLIEEKGIRFIRITNEQINKDTQILLKKITGN